MPEQWEMGSEFLTKSARPIDNRPQANSLPYLVADASGGYAAWAASYDDTPNPLLALEMRILSERIDSLRILDAGCGTGRWMRALTSRGARVFGIDACDEMIRRAPAPVALGDLRRIPFKDSEFDTAICSFVIGYAPCNVIHELARVARRVIVTDLHPAAVAAGWTRSFRAGGEVIHLQHYAHSIVELDACAQDVGLSREWRAEACFGEPERPIFERAGKRLDEVSHIPAVLATIWRR